MLTDHEVREGRQSIIPGLSAEVVQRIGEVIVAWRSFEGALTFVVAACKGVPGEDLKPGLQPFRRILNDLNNIIESGKIDQFRPAIISLYLAAVDLAEYRHTLVHGRGILIRSDGSAAEYWKHNRSDQIDRRVVSLSLLDQAIGAIWIIDRACVALERDILGHSRPLGPSFMDREEAVTRARAVAAYIMQQTRLP